MDILILILLSLLYFLWPKRTQKYVNVLLTSAFAVVTSVKAVAVLFLGKPWHFSIQFWDSDVSFSMDGMSAFFVLIINFTVLTATLYSFRYMDLYKNKSQAETALHYFSFFTLQWSMILVTLLQNTIGFLVVWEIMSLSSFMLVLLEAEKSSVRKAGLNYLIQMHVGSIFLLVAIIILQNGTGMWNWDALPQYFSGNSNTALFFLFFIGFGLKAGFIPLHTWLPHAHPAAPTHISAIMSGVMIKLGIFGILKVTFSLQDDFLLIGIIVLTISLISGISGVGVAIIQHNLKKLLAYHSIENIGIIGIGIGIGLIGMSVHNPALIWMGFTGCFLHVLNHSLFKSLLFYGAGSVYFQTHSVNIDSMGGLLKRMPYTAFFFLIASMAICGLPPFNGFVSEFIIYNGFIEGLQSGSILIQIIMIFSLMGLTAIGGLAIFCFTKAFGIIFLGNPRSNAASCAHEMRWQALLPQALIVIVILSIGIFPEVFILPVSGMIAEQLPLADMPSYDFSYLSNAGYAGAGFIILVVVLWVIRSLIFRHKSVTDTVTWNCGYSGEAAKTQYTASSYAENYAHGMDTLLKVKTHFTPVDEMDLFPADRKYKTHSESLIEEKLILKPIRAAYYWLKKLAFVQTGQTQHYILYAFVLLLVLTVLTLFNAI